ncbi:MAG TPA: Ig-like domain-containing protein, partial [Terracidiphilus sp.]
MRVKNLSFVLLSSLICVVFTLAGCGGSSTAASPTLQSIAVTPAAPSIAKGLTQQFTAKGTYSDSSTQDITTSVTWSSSDSSKATISASSGLATALAAGTTNITASLSGVTSPADALTVTAPAPTLVWIAVTPTDASVYEGHTIQFTAKGGYSDLSVADITSTVTWNSDTPATATIASGGVATAVAAGQTGITASLSGVTSAEDVLTVEPNLVTSIVVSAASVSVAPGGTDQFKAVGTFSDLSTADITNSVTWSSSNTSYATVDSTTGLVTGVAVGSTYIYAYSARSKVQGSASLSVTAVVRNYSGSASVGDFVSFTVDQNKNTLSYNNISNGQTGTVSYSQDAFGSITLNDPSSHLLAVTEVPGYGMVALMNNAGAAADQLALITSINEQQITADSFDGQKYNMFEFRTKGGGVGIAPIAIDSNSNFSGTEFMPFNLLGSNNSGFNLLSGFQLSAVATSPSPDYLFVQLPEPPANSGKNYIFGAPNGMFLVDSEDGSMIGLPKASSKDFDSSWANTYTFTYYEKSNAYGPDGNSQEAGDISGGVGTLTLDSSGNLSLNDGSGNTMATGQLSAVADTASLYDGTTTGGPATVGELGDPAWGVFTFTDASSGQPQQVFAAFAGTTVLLSSFKTAASFNPGDNYDYFYGVGTPISESLAYNTGALTNSGGSSTASAPGAWNSLGGTISETAQRLYAGSSTNGDLLTFTIDPSAGTLAYYDVTNGNRSATPSTITYTLNVDGSSTVTDPNSNVLGALELPDQALFVEMNNTGFNLPNPAPPDLVIALPQMNLTGGDFTSQSYNFLQMMTANGDETIGSMTIDVDGNFTANGVTPQAISTGSYFQYNFGNLDALTFPLGNYPAPWIATTDTNASGPLFERGSYLFGYPGSLIILNTATQGTLVGAPQASSAAFQPTVGGNPITGTYKVIFLRRQVTGIQNGVESGPTGSPTGTAPNCTGGWKCLQQTDGVSMGIDTLVVLSNGAATLTD